MALTEMQAAQVEKLFAPYCAKRVPPAARSKLRVTYRLEGNAIVLFEERPAFHAPHDWLITMKTGRALKVVNLKNAKALGLMIPPSLLQRADQIIQ